MPLNSRFFYLLLKVFLHAGLLVEILELLGGLLAVQIEANSLSELHFERPISFEGSLDRRLVLKRFSQLRFELVGNALSYFHRFDFLKLIIFFRLLLLLLEELLFRNGLEAVRVQLRCFFICFLGVFLRNLGQLAYFSQVLFTSRHLVFEFI